jgi:hypothetical protein
MKMKLGDVMYTLQHGAGTCLPGSLHFLQSAIPPAVLAKTYTNMERRVSFCL